MCLLAQHPNSRPHINHQCLQHQAASCLCAARDLTDTEVIVEPSEAADVKQEVKEEVAAEAKAE
jgi:hypothetical protein